MLIFFDDILIYSNSWEDHVRHVDKVLQQLKEQQLYAKPSKCFFGVKEVEYLVLEYNGCARFTIDNISIVTQP